MSRTARAFSIIELLVVMLIIGLVVAIVLPALGGAREAAKKTDTQNLVSMITQAIGNYENTNKRLPGPFSARDLGGRANEARGMSAMENMLVDLLGYESQASGTGGAVQIGPTNNTNEQLWYNFSKVPENPPYLGQLSAKFLVKQRAGAESDPTTQQVAATAHGEIPDIVDSFGAPILVWPEDDTASGAPYAATRHTLAGQPASSTVLVREDSAQPAKFYWNANHCFLKAPSLGRDGRNQTATPGSFLASGDEKARTQSLAGILGNPSYAAYSTGDADRTTWNNVEQIYPTASRGKYIVQAAGPDGLYLSKKSRSGNRGASFAQGSLLYGLSLMPPNAASAAEGHRDANGKPTTLDLASEFDDIISAGN